MGERGRVEASESSELLFVCCKGRVMVTMAKVVVGRGSSESLFTSEERIGGILS